jgi:outer membrane protein OmpA-like peptidoglycan-associated protein
MKFLKKFGLLILMLTAIAIAFVLPKFVQRTQPPTPKEDLAAALAAVAVDPPASGEEQVATEPAAATNQTGLRSDARFAGFFAAIDVDDFEAAGTAFLALGEEVGPDQRALLTAEMEKAVGALAPDPAKAPTPPADNSIASLDAPVGATSAPAPDAVVESPPPASPAPSPEDLVRFMGRVQSGEFEAARAQLAELRPLVDLTTATMLETTLSAAEKRETELAATRREVAKIQQESLAQMQESLKQLSEATVAAKEAVAETTRLREEWKTSAAAAVSASASATSASATPAPELPETVWVTFGRGSTFLGGPNEAKLAPVVAALTVEPRLLLQLRGHSDASGNTEYNAILARARCEVVRDFLVTTGIDAKRLEVISFGDTQANSSGKTPEELRRVDLIFQAE